MAQGDNLCSIVWQKEIICVKHCVAKNSLCSTVLDKEIIFSYSVVQGDKLCSNVWHKGIICIVHFGTRG